MRVRRRVRHAHRALRVRSGLSLAAGSPVSWLPLAGTDRGTLVAITVMALVLAALVIAWCLFGKPTE